MIQAHASQGPTKTGYYPDIFATVLENPHVLHPPFCLPIMSSQKMLYNIFQPLTTKQSQTSSTGQKRKSDEQILPSFVILVQVVLTIPITSVPFERGITEQSSKK